MYLHISKKSSTFAVEKDTLLTLLKNINRICIAQL